MFPLAFTATEWCAIIPVAAAAIVKSIIDLRANWRRDADLDQHAKDIEALKEHTFFPPHQKPKHGCSTAAQISRAMEHEYTHRATKHHPKP